MNESNSHPCEECNRTASSTFCYDCDEKMCKPCNDMIHRGGKRKYHKRDYLCICESESSHSCSTCQIFLCESCAYVHCHATLEKMKSCNLVAVFWDLGNMKNTTDKELKETLEWLTSKYQVSSIKVYGEGQFRSKQISASPLLEFSNNSGLRELETLLLDISLTNKDNLSEILVISSKAYLFKPHLTQIQSGMPSVKILVSTSFPFLNFCVVKDLKDKQNNIKLGRPVSDYVQTGALQVFQNFPRKKGQSYSHDLLVSILKELAESGQVMNEAGLVCKTLAQRARFSMEESNKVIKQAEESGYVHTVQRSFMDLKTVFFICLKIESLSCESLLWALQSLKLDEMLPSERAVQSRVKEVFDYKIQPSEWESFLDSCRLRHNHKNSSPISYSLFAKPSAPARPSFTLKEFLDPVSKQKIVLIYPKGEVWDSKDQHIKEGDILAVKQTSQWQAFVEFLTEYFSAGLPGDESRAIPGGRYGCAQFLKYCGNPVLRSSSLGLISYMVQLSIDECLLKYYRTLLVWVDNTQKIDEKENEKILFVKSKILETLKENKEGLSLAQLPLYVKVKINLAEMGFAKLKDLLLTMDEVEIELRGNNHPFAVFRPKNKKEREIHGFFKADPVGGSQKPEKFYTEKKGFLGRQQEFKNKEVGQLGDNGGNLEIKEGVFSRKEKSFFEERNCLKDESKFLGFAGFQSCLESFEYRNPPGF